MKFALFAALVLFGAGCEKKPTPEEIERQQEEMRARATPTPKPGLTKEKMKEYKNPLNQKP